MENPLYIPTTPPTAPSGPSKSRLPLIIAVAAGAVLATYLITTFIRQSGTGTLKVTASATKAKLAVVGNGSSQDLGTGHATAHLKPGTYQVTATQNDAVTAQSITISKGATATVNLTLQPVVPAAKLTSANAKNIFVAPDHTLYFIDTNQSILKRYTIGDATPRPYLTNNSAVAQVYWLSPTQFYYRQNDGSWQYTVNGRTVPLLDSSLGALDDSVTFGSGGMFGFATKTSGYLVTAPGQAPQNLTALTSDTIAGIAPNGTVLFATPPGSDGQTVTARLYQAGRFTNLPSAVSTATNAQWSPDSTKFTYDTTSGTYLYDTKTQTSTLIHTDTPGTPGSLIWVANDRLVYALSDTVWSYTIGQPASTKLAHLDGIINGPRSFTLGADGQTLYYGTSGNDDGDGGGLFQLVLNYHSLSSSQQKAATPTTVSEPTYQGDGDLTDSGITTDQLTNLKYAVTHYAHTQGKTLKTVTFTDVEAAFRNPQSDSTVNTYTFDLVFNDNEAYHAKLEVTDLSTVRLYLTQSGQSVYDSGPITSQ
jgi:hypothetical protein